MRNFGRSSPATISFWFRRSGDDFCTGTSDPMARTCGGTTSIGEGSSEHWESHSEGTEKKVYELIIRPEWFFGQLSLLARPAIHNDFTHPPTDQSESLRKLNTSFSGCVWFAFSVHQNEPIRRSLLPLLGSPEAFRRRWELNCIGIWAESPWIGGESLMKILANYISSWEYSNHY